MVDQTEYKHKFYHVYDKNLLMFQGNDEDLKGADLCDVNLNHVNLQGLNLEGVILRCAYLSQANLSGSNLQGARLRGAKLEGADLRGADLRGADLYFTDLSDADLQGAILQGAKLDGANLRGAFLYNTIGNGREIKTIQTPNHIITYTNEQMAIGYEQYSIKEWFSFSDEEIEHIDEGNYLQFWKEWKPRLKEIFDTEGVEYGNS